MLIELKKIDSEGNIIGTEVFETMQEMADGSFVEKEIPEGYREGWGRSGRSFFKPKWDFSTEDWVESETEEEVMNLAKQSKKNQVNFNVGVACTKGFTSTATGWTYETEQHDQTNFSRRWVTLLADPAITEVSWKTADGITRVHTREQFIAVCEELDDFITSKVEAGWYIKNVLIKEAQTLEELQQISLEVE